MINAAFEYISEGFGALPLKSDKSPMLPSGHGYLYELINENDIDKLFINAEKIGIACGEVSGNFECLDFDAHENEPIRKVFNEFMNDTGVQTIIDQHGLPVVKTPSGGYHIYYRCETLQSGLTLSRWKSGAVMIETRGHGQYAATIPSKGYNLLKGTQIIKTGVISEDERDFIISVAENFSQVIVEKKAEKGVGKWPVKYDTTTVWGRYNETESEQAKELLLRAGWNYARTRKNDGVEMWTRPGKLWNQNASQPVSATFGKLHNMFYCFSDSAAPFRSETAYSLFDIFILLGHDGDKVAAIKDLEERYGIIHYKPMVNKKTVNFPVGVFPDIITNYINEQNEVSNFDENLMASTFVWLMSTLIGNRFSTFVNDNWDVSPVMWMMIIAERGSTKTHAINAVIGAAKKLDNITRKEFEEEISEYEKIKDDQNAKKPTWRQIFLEDGTREGYTKAMKYNPTGLGLMKDELTGWIADMDRHSGTKGGDEAFWLSSFNNTSYTKNIKGDDGTHVNRMFINLAGSIQPGIINDMVSKHSINGLFDRFLLVPYIETEFKFSMIRPELSYFIEYNNFIEHSVKVLNKFPDGGSFRFMNNAAIEFETTYNKFLQIKYKDTNPAISAYIAKIITYLPRMCLIIEITDQLHNIFTEKSDYIDVTIGINSVRKSFDILRYFLNNARNVLFDIDVKTDLIDIIKASGAIRKRDKIKAIIESGANISDAEFARFLGTTRQNIRYHKEKCKVKAKEKNDK